MALLLGGCATQAPVDQVKYFSQAFAAVNTVGQPLLDDLAIAEATQGRANAVTRAKRKQDNGDCKAENTPWQESRDPRLGVIAGFCVSDAGYFAELGDPPATAQLRGALSVIQRYADVLTTLAGDKNLEEAKSEVNALGQEVGGLISIAGVQTAIAPALVALQPLLENAARQNNAAEARRLILDGAVKISDLIGALRGATPAMFNTLTEDATLVQLIRSNTPAAVVSDIENRRKVVSQYVVLLGRLQEAWNRTVAAAREPGQARLSDLITRTAELRANADAVRRTLAVVRSGTAPRP